MAKEFKVVVAHQLPTQEAVRRIKLLLGDLREVYGSQISDVQEEWEGSLCTFGLKMFVFRIAGSIMVGSSAVEVRGRMPLGTGKYEEKVGAVIEERAKALLAVRPEPGPVPLQPPQLGP